MRVRLRGKGSEMLSWLHRRRETAERIEAEANALIDELGVEAYGHGFPPKTIFAGTRLNLPLLG
jgi:hypothetical protein